MLPLRRRIRHQTFAPAGERLGILDDQSRIHQHFAVITYQRRSLHHWVDLAELLEGSEDRYRAMLETQTQQLQGNRHPAYVGRVEHSDQLHGCTCLVYGSCDQNSQIADGRNTLYCGTTRNSEEWRLAGAFQEAVLDPAVILELRLERGAKFLGDLRCPARNGVATARLPVRLHPGGEDEACRVMGDDQ